MDGHNSRQIDSRACRQHRVICGVSSKLRDAHLMSPSYRVPCYACSGPGTEIGPSPPEIAGGSLSP
jgi:hypothetical protein